ncbi:MAG: hypothetical protein CMJ58_24435 [Planctomycetaceae bacterium]|nr:hypothetical protein [Planctomycetaceae bacterium]
MWRHGDVFIEKAGSVPPSAAELPHCILAKGELTGHAHRVEPRGAATLYRSGDSLYLRVTADRATLMHEEHAPINLDKGVYRAWIQREYSPQEIRRVVD